VHRSNLVHLSSVQSCPTFFVGQNAGNSEVTTVK
jgi:hypothetical protein